MKGKCREIRRKSKKTKKRGDAETMGAAETIETPRERRRESVAERGLGEKR